MGACPACRRRPGGSARRERQARPAAVQAGRPTGLLADIGTRRWCGEQREMQAREGVCAEVEAERGDRHVLWCSKQGLLRLPLPGVQDLVYKLLACMTAPASHHITPTCAEGRLAAPDEVQLLTGGSRPALVARSGTHASRRAASQVTTERGGERRVGRRVVR